MNMQDRTITDTLGLFHTVVRVPKEPIIGFFRCDSRGPKGRSISPIKAGLHAVLSGSEFVTVPGRLRNI